MRATLVDREAAIVHANALQEHDAARHGARHAGLALAALVKPVEADPAEPPEEEKSKRQLVRDAVVVVMVVAALVLAFPQLEAMLPDDVRSQIETVGGLFAPAAPEIAAPYRRRGWPRPSPRWCIP